MFDANLLDSSPERVPVLEWRHWVGAFGVGVMSGIASYLLLPLMFSPSSKARLFESLLLGIAAMLYELMLWYVLADARHLGLNAWRWSIVLLVLNVAGFVAYLVYSAYKTGDWKRAALPIAYMLEGIVVCVLLLVPLIYTQALPDSRWSLTTIPPPPLGTHTGNPNVKPIIHTPVRFDTNVQFIFPQPFKLPNDETETGNATENPGGPGTMGLPLEPGPIGDPFGSPIGSVMPQPLKPVVKSPTPIRVYRPTSVQEAKLIFGPKPEYPQMARITRTQGEVELKAIIGKDGTIQELKVISGSPLLIRAAVDAVSRWRYQPTLLNGEPVEVVTDITVNFILSE
ncbi:MAG TPA: energy transducer TonB [Terriglobia bacterium]|nr:energy transducer TonB [Terriglobia bacterium]